MTNAVAASLERLAQDLAAVHARWALIGGFAVSARADARFTRDVDVCVLVADDEEAERLALAMTRLGYAVSALIEHELARRLSTLRLVSPVDGAVLVDLLFASSGIEAENRRGGRAAGAHGGFGRAGGRPGTRRRYAAWPA